MNRPIATTWELGKDKHGRRVLLHFRNGEFQLESEASSQRDEGERMFSLTRDVLIAAGEVAKDSKP